MRINLPRHDLLGEERLTNLSEEKCLEHLFPWVFIGFSLHRNRGHIPKAHQSLSGSNDQGIDNIQRTIRAYSFKKMFYCCSITVVCIFSSLLYPTPAKHTPSLASPPAPPLGFVYVSFIVVPENL